MISEDKKRLDIFVNSINELSHKEYTKIRKETDNYIERELKLARVKAKEEVKNTKDVKIDKLNEKNNEDLSELKITKLSTLLKEREKITNKVFDCVKEKLINFTLTKEYEQFLKASAKKILEATGNDTVIYLRKDDEKYIEVLKEYFKDIKIDNSIYLGGIKAKNDKMNIFIDDTFDSKLAEEKEKFHETSGLYISL